VIKGFKKGDLIEHILDGRIGILITIRPLDILTDNVGNLYHVDVFDAYVILSKDGPTWVPLEHLKKLS
jgi:hypothetical protein